MRYSYYLVFVFLGMIQIICCSEHRPAETNPICSIGGKNSVLVYSISKNSRMPELDFPEFIVIEKKNNASQRPSHGMQYRNSKGIIGRYRFSNGQQIEVERIVQSLQIVNEEFQWYDSKISVQTINDYVKSMETDEEFDMENLLQFGNRPRHP